MNWPNNGDINAWADFVETICMFSESDSLSIDEFIDFLEDDATKTNTQLLTALNFDENFLSIPIPSINPPFPIEMPLTGAFIDDGMNKRSDNDDDDDEFDGEDQENIDRENLRSRILILFTFILSRQSYFGSAYPFKILRGNSIVLKDDLSELQRLYIVLLLSSEMNFFTPANRNKIGHMFEWLCKFPFQYLLPIGAEKKFFGAGAGSILNVDYTGNLHGKLEALAQDLNIRTNNNIEDPDELGPNGDAGLDWVGWIPFDDHCDHQPVYFGQCACGSNWISKQHETSLSTWRNFLELTQSIQCFHFMPRSFRRNSLEWFRRTQIVQELILVDRYRLIKIFNLMKKDDIDEILNQYANLLEDAATFEYDRQN